MIPDFPQFCKLFGIAFNLRTGMAGGKVFRISNGKRLGKRVGPVLVNGRGLG
jgi:hypothetical protein